VASGDDFDDLYGNSRNDEIRELFEDALSHSYQDDPQQLNDAFLMMEYGWIMDDVSPDVRDAAREEFFDILGIETEDFDWDHWREINGY